MSTVNWAHATVRAAIAQLVDSAADSAGVPRNVLRAIVLAESGGDPHAVGDAGESIGLLQLHARGQGAGMSVGERQDPRRNLAVGVPPIARAWHATAAMPYDRARVERVAVTSGHPSEDIDRLTPGSQGWRIAMEGAAKIGTWWAALERAHPSAATTTKTGTPAAKAAPATVGAGLDALRDAAASATSWAGSHPALALAGGLGVLALVLL